MWNKYQILYRQLGNAIYIYIYIYIYIEFIYWVECQGLNVEGEGKKARVKSQGLNVDC